ncbi:TRAP transporter large permease subunit, partial [Mycobacterium tuberculosis]|nr:TRAP transporter large permease subunit [Mycobacterium tuberculosis]
VDIFPGWHAVAVSFVSALPGLFIIAIILGLIVAGVTTPTEAAGIAVTYSLFLTFIVYRTMNWDKLMKASAKAAKTTGIV